MIGQGASIRQLFSLMNKDGGIAQLMLQPAYAAEDGGEATIAQAELIADMLNIMRLDVKRMGEAAGVDIKVDRMTPEQAALDIQKLVKGESLALVHKFRNLEDKRERVIEAMEGEEALQQHQDVKESVLFSHQPDNDQDPAEATMEDELPMDPDDDLMNEVRENLPDAEEEEEDDDEE